MNGPLILTSVGGGVRYMSIAIGHCVCTKSGETT
jgi:hypothetical protein